MEFGNLWLLQWTKTFCDFLTNYFTLFFSTTLTPTHKHKLTHTVNLTHTPTPTHTHTHTHTETLTHTHTPTHTHTHTHCETHTEPSEKIKRIPHNDTES